MPLGIIINGALGRMGKEVAGVVLKDNNCSLRGAIEYREHPLMGKDYGECVGRGTIGIKVCSSIEETDCSNSVCIDFSTAGAVCNLISKAAEKKVPVVIGTTALGEDNIKFIRSFSSDIPILISPNMSLGINLLFLLTEIAAKRLKGIFDIEIIEAHHRHKRDAPSGTAKRLGEIAAAALGIDYNLHVKDGRKGVSETDRSQMEIGMHAVRGGDIVGDHTVLFAGEGERIELKHIAHSRSTFAQGAVAAARWLYNKKAGMYSMRDVLDF